jgi:plastocyanin
MTAASRLEFLGTEGVMTRTSCRLALLMTSPLIALLATLILASPPVAQPATSGNGAGVVIQTFQFQPTPLAVKAGTLVTWTNNDDIEHTVTAGTPEAAMSDLTRP